jgi:hypothetical protein
MTRKLYILLSLVLTVSFMLAACGASATEAPPAATDEPAVTEPTEPPAPRSQPSRH